MCYGKLGWVICFLSLPYDYLKHFKLDFDYLQGKVDNIMEISMQTSMLTN